MQVAKLHVIVDCRKNMSLRSVLWPAAECRLGAAPDSEKGASAGTGHKCAGATASVSVL